MINLFDYRDKLEKEDATLYGLLRYNSDHAMSLDYKVFAAVTSNGNLTISAGGMGMTRMSVAYFLSSDDAKKIADVYNAKPYETKVQVSPISKSHLTRIFNKAGKELLIPYLEEFDTNYGKCYILKYKKDTLKKENLELFIFKTIDDRDLLKIEDYSTKGNTHLRFMDIITRNTLFEIKQASDDNLQFLIELKHAGEEFRYYCTIKTKADYINVLDRTIDALDSYPQFRIYRDQLQEIRDIYK